MLLMIAASKIHTKIQPRHIYLEIFHWTQYDWTWSFWIQNMIPFHTQPLLSDLGLTNKEVLLWKQPTMYHSLPYMRQNPCFTFTRKPHWNSVVIDLKRCIEHCKLNYLRKLAGKLTAFPGSVHLGSYCHFKRTDMVLSQSMVNNVILYHCCLSPYCFSLTANMTMTIPLAHRVSNWLHDPSSSWENAW